VRLCSSSASAGFLPGLLYYAEDGGVVFLRNFGLLRITLAYHPEDRNLQVLINLFIYDLLVCLLILGLESTLSLMIIWSRVSPWLVSNELEMICKVEVVACV
jgi:hypothetical protein